MNQISDEINSVLGFCIPTYKRPELLKKCVQSIIADGARHNIPIYIADDSCDETNTAVINELMQSYRNIFYVKNSENLGIDKNIQHVITICSCEYAWPVGEDDILFPGAVSRALQLIAKSRPPFIYSNYVYVSNDHSTVTGGPKILGNNEEIKAFELFQDHLWKMGFIGACIVNKSKWDSVSGEPYLGTFFAHIGRIFAALNPDDNIGVLAEPNIGNRAENTNSFTWSPKYYQVFFGFEEMLKKVSEAQPRLLEYLPHALELCRQHFKHKTVRSAIIKKAKGIYTLQTYKTYFSKEPILRRLAFYLIAAAPTMFFSTGLTVAKKILSKSD